LALAATIGASHDCAQAITAYATITPAKDLNTFFRTILRKLLDPPSEPVLC
jgi:hypothetical protein